MSKDAHRLTRKRYERLMAEKYGVQVREMHDAVTEHMVNPLKRMQEAANAEKHRRTVREGRKR